MTKSQSGIKVSCYDEIYKKAFVFLTILFLVGEVSCRDNAQKSETSLKEKKLKEQNLLLESKLQAANQDNEQLRYEFNTLLETASYWKYMSFHIPLSFKYCDDDFASKWSKKQADVCATWRKTYDRVDYSKFKGGPEVRKTEGTFFVCNLNGLAPEDMLVCNDFIQALKKAASFFHFEDDFVPLPEPKSISKSGLATDHKGPDKNILTH